MAKQGPDAVALAIVATLNTGLATELTNVWTDWGDSATVTIPVFPAASVVAYDWEEQHGYPSISVVPEMWPVTQDGSPLWQLIEYHLRILVYLTDSQLGVLQKRMMRTLRAVRRTLMHYPQLDGSLPNYQGMTPGEGVLFEAYRNHKTHNHLQVGGMKVTVRCGEMY